MTFIYELDPYSLEIHRMCKCYGWGATSEYRFKIGDFAPTGPVDPKFQVEGVAPTNYSSSQKTRLNDLSYGIKSWTDLSSVLSHSTRFTDERTDRQTGSFFIARRHLHSMERGKNGPVLMAHPVNPERRRRRRDSTVDYRWRLLVSESMKPISPSFTSQGGLLASSTPWIDVLHFSYNLHCRFWDGAFPIACVSPECNFPWATLCRWQTTITAYRDSFGQNNQCRYYRIQDCFFNLKLIAREQDTQTRCFAPVTLTLTRWPWCRNLTEIVGRHTCIQILLRAVVLRLGSTDTMVRVWVTGKNCVVPLLQTGRVWLLVAVLRASLLCSMWFIIIIIIIITEIFRVA